MGISGISGNPYANIYNQNKETASSKKTAQDDRKQEQVSESKETATTQPAYRNTIMVNGLYRNVDPTGEIASKAYFEELARQINESICKIQTYYAKAHEENMSFENPYNHILEKYNSNVYKLFKSPYFRSDMTEAERKMAFDQEMCQLRGEGFANLSDSYAWASSGGVPARDKQLEDAVQAAFDKRREEMLKEVGGESTYEEYSSKILERFTARYTNLQETEKMGEINLRA